MEKNVGRRKGFEVVSLRSGPQEPFPSWGPGVRIVSFLVVSGLVCVTLRICQSRVKGVYKRLPSPGQMLFVSPPCLIS